MTTKSILIIGDSGLLSGGAMPASFKNNVTGLSIINRAVNGSSLAHWYTGAYTVRTRTPGTGPIDCTPRLEAGHEYIWVSLSANDFLHQTEDWVAPYSVGNIITDYLSFIDSLVTLGYPYPKILFHFKYPLTIDVFDWGGQTPGCGITDAVEVSVTTEAGAIAATNRNRSYFRSTIMPELISKGVTIIDEWDFALNHKAEWRLQVEPLIIAPAVYYPDEYILNVGIDGLHISGTTTLADIWAKNLMSLIRDAIKEH